MVQYLDLSTLERSYYDKRHDEVKKQVRGLLSRSAQLSSGVMSSLTQLRQICCHPQIVRRDDGMLGSSGQRLTMAEIVERYVVVFVIGVFVVMLLRFCCR